MRIIWLSLALVVIGCTGCGSGSGGSVPPVQPNATGQQAPPMSQPSVEDPVANRLPGSCRLVPERYCASGQVVEWRGMKMLAFRLPPEAGVFAPFEGVLRPLGPEAFGGLPPGLTASVCQEVVDGRFTGREVVAIGDLVIPEGSTDVLLGIGFLGKVGASGATVVGDRNVLVAFRRLVDGRMQVDEESMRNVVPYYR